eukprot:m.211026 g.211026  ORF g.211026 m.211026 type:complete len:2758 (+) comp13784_c3_seq1:154-8427(+)
MGCQTSKGTDVVVVASSSSLSVVDQLDDKNKNYVDNNNESNRGVEDKVKSDNATVCGYNSLSVETLNNLSVNSESRQGIGVVDIIGQQQQQHDQDKEEQEEQEGGANAIKSLLDQNKTVDKKRRSSLSKFVVTAPSISTKEETVTANEETTKESESSTSILSSARTKARRFRNSRLVKRVDTEPVEGTSVSIFDAPLMQKSPHDGDRFKGASENWTRTLVQATIEIHEILLTHFTPTVQRCLYRFDERDLKHCFVEIAARVSPGLSLPVVLLVWVTTLVLVYQRRIIDLNDILRFRTIVQDIIRKRFNMDLMPKAFHPPLWLPHHEAFSINSTFVDYSTNNCDLICPKELFAHLSGLNISLFSKKSSIQSHSYLNHREQSGALRRGLETRLPKHSRQALLEVHRASFDAIFRSLADSLHAFVKTSESRAVPSALRLPGSDVDMVGSIVNHLQMNTFRPNVVLVSEHSEAIVSLCGHISGFETVIARHTDSLSAMKRQFVDLIMRAGTRDEKVLFATNLAGCASSVVSMLSSFIKSCDIMDLLSPDNVVAVSTLTQPRVIASGLQPTLANSWKMFQMILRQNLRVVLMFPGEKSVSLQLNLINYDERVLSHVVVFASPPITTADYEHLANRSLSESLSDIIEHCDASVIGRLTPLVTTMFEAMKRCDGKSEDDTIALSLFNMIHFDAFVRQSAAFLRMQWMHISAEAQRLKNGLVHAKAAEEHVVKLQQSHTEYQNIWKEKDDITTRLLTQIGRDLAALKRIEQKQQEQQSILYSLEEKLPDFRKKYDKVMEVSNTFMISLKKYIGMLSEDSVRVLQIKARVPTNIEVLFAGLLVLINNYDPDDLASADLSWRLAGRRLCSDVDRLKSQLTDVLSTSIATETLTEISLMIESGDVEFPEKMRFEDFQKRVKLTSANGGKYDRRSVGEFDNKEMDSIVDEDEQEVEVDDDTQSQQSGDEVESRLSGRAMQDKKDESFAFQILSQFLLHALVLHGHLNAEARPLEQEYNNFIDEINKCKFALENLEQSYSAVLRRVKALQSSFDTSTRVKNEQKRALGRIFNDLHKAESYLEAMRDEKQSWMETLQELQEDAAYLEANSLLAAGVRTFFPGLSSSLRESVMRLWIQAVIDKGLKVVSVEEPLHRRASAFHPRRSTMGQRKSDASFLVDDTHSFDVTHILPLMCSKTQVVEGHQQGDDEFFFVNRSLLSWGTTWKLVLDPNGYGLEHIMRVETHFASTQLNDGEDDAGDESGDGGGENTTTMNEDSTGNYKTSSQTKENNSDDMKRSNLNHLVVVDLMFGASDWDQIEEQLTDAFNGKYDAVVLINTPPTMSDSLRAFLKPMWDTARVLVRNDDGGSDLLSSTSVDTVRPNKGGQASGDNRSRRDPGVVSVPHGDARKMQQRLSLDVNGHVVTQHLQTRVYMCGPSFDLADWLAFELDCFSFVSYSKIPIQSSKQFVGSSIYPLFWKCESDLSNQYISQLFSLEEQRMECIHTLVSSIQHSNGGLPDASDVMNVIELKKRIIVQIERTEEMLDLISDHREISEYIADICCIIVRIVTSLNTLDGTYDFSAPLLIRQFVTALRDSYASESFSQGGGDGVDDSNTCGDDNGSDGGTINLRYASMTTLNFIRGQLKDHHRPVLDVLAYFEVFLPIFYSNSRKSDETDDDRADVRQSKRGKGEEEQAIRIDTKEAIRDDDEEGATSSDHDGTFAEDGELQNAQLNIYFPVSEEVDMLLSSITPLYMDADALMDQQRKHRKKQQREGDAYRPPLRYKQIHQDNNVEQEQPLLIRFAKLVHGNSLATVLEDALGSSEWGKWVKANHSDISSPPKLVAPENSGLSRELLDFYELLLVKSVKPSVFMLHLHKYTNDHLPGEELFVVPSFAEQLEEIFSRRYQQAHMRYPVLPTVQHSIPTPILIQRGSGVSTTEYLISTIARVFSFSQPMMNVVHVTLGCVSLEQLKFALSKLTSPKTLVVLEAIEHQPEFHDVITRFVADTTLQSERGSSGKFGRLVIIVDDKALLSSSLSRLCITLAVHEEQTVMDTLDRLTACFGDVLSAVQTSGSKEAALTISALGLCHAVLSQRDKRNGWFTGLYLADVDLVAVLTRIADYLHHDRDLPDEAALDVKKTLLSVVYSEYKTSFYNVWDLRSLESIMALLLGGDLEETIQDFGMELNSLMSRHDSVVAHHGDEEKRQQRRSSFENDDGSMDNVVAHFQALQDILQQHTLKSSFLFQQESNKAFSNLQTARAVFDHFKMSSAIESSLFLQHSKQTEASFRDSSQSILQDVKDLCIRALSYVPTLKILDDAPLQYSFPCMYSLARSELERLIAHCEGLVRSINHTSLLVAHLPMLMGKSLEICNSLHKGIVPASWSMISNRSNVTLFMYMRNILERVHLLSEMLSTDTLMKIDVRTSSVPQTFLAALRMDTHADVTQITNACVPSQGYVTFELPLHGMVLEGCMITEEGYVTVTNEASSSINKLSSDFDTQVVIRCVTENDWENIGGMNATTNTSPKRRMSFLLSADPASMVTTELLSHEPDIPSSESDELPRRRRSTAIRLSMHENFKYVDVEEEDELKTEETVKRESGDGEDEEKEEKEEEMGNKADESPESKNTAASKSNSDCDENLNEVESERGNGKSGAKEKGNKEPPLDVSFHDISEAYGVLSDPSRRRSYDLWLSSDVLGLSFTDWEKTQMASHMHFAMPMSTTKPLTASGGKEEDDNEGNSRKRSKGVRSVANGAKVEKFRSEGGKSMSDALLNFRSGGY